MASLAGLNNLRRLDLRNSPVRGTGLRRLRKLKHLTVRITLDSEDMETIDGAMPIDAPTWQIAN